MGRIRKLNTIPSAVAPKSTGVTFSGRGRGGLSGPPLPEPIPMPRPIPEPIPMPRPIPEPMPMPRPIPEPEFGGFTPPLYRPVKFLPDPEVWWPWYFRSLREGCYLVRYTSVTNPWSSFFHYDGTIRVERDGFNTIASGDLYSHSLFTIPYYSNCDYLPEPNPAAGIPIFPIDKYRYYLRITQILESFTTLNSFTLGFERYRFNSSDNTWTDEGDFTALMVWTTAPPDYPSSSDYLTGEVKDSSGNTIANLTMGWVSPFLRKAVIEIDRVSQSEPALDNGDAEDWRTVFNGFDWDVAVVESNVDVPEPDPADPNGFWSDAELHEALLNWRDSTDLDKEWRYHLLCVRRLDSTSRGIMYDAYGSDSNNVPREAAAIATGWNFPNNPTWGLVAGNRFGASAGPYFRAAVHEIGHAQGIFHNTNGNVFMNVTPTIAANGTAANPFPNNITWAHAPEDQKRLRHYPDIWVRPGGIPFDPYGWGSYGSTPLSPDDSVLDADGLDLDVNSLLDSVPMGAPVRVNINLTNSTKEPLPAPVSLSFKSGCVSGSVIEPSGAIKTFRSIILYEGSDEIHNLAPKISTLHSLTLLRGAQGALFASPGVHKIIVNVQWNVEGFEVGVSGGCHVMITPPVDEDHAKAALKILTTPDTLLTLALGGDHIEEGIEAIAVGLKNKTLRPHYAVIEAKRKGKKFNKRKADVKAAAKLIDKDAVLSGPELKRVAEIALNGSKKAKGDTAKKIATVLKDKIKSAEASNEIRDLIKKM